MPDIQTFYSLSVSEIVTQICLVFRNADANLQTRPDIFIAVFQVGLNVTFTLPVSSSFVSELNSHVMISVSATSADSVSLYINNKFIKSGKTADLVTQQSALPI